MSGVIRCVFASCSRHQLRLTAGQQMCDSYQLCVRPTYSMLVLMSEPEVYQPLLFQSGLSTRKKKKKNKKLLLSFLTCRRFCVGCWCKPHGFFFVCVFPSYLSLWCLSLDLRLFLQLFHMIFWMEDWNTMNFRGSTPFWHQENQGQIIEEPLLRSTLSPDSSMKF